MKKIIVPVDFSEYSENALKVAAQIAKKHNAEIVAVHMMGLSEAKLIKESNSVDSLFLIKLTKIKFESFLDKPYLDGVTVYQTVKNYTVFSELDEVAIAHNADIIIMGSHGSSGIQEVFVGSNTEKVVRTSQTPVLVIKDKDTFNVSKAVFACDFKTENISSFKNAMNIFKILDIEVKLVFINIPGKRFFSTKEIDQQILDFMIHLKEYKLIPEDVVIYSDYSVENGVFNYAKKINADIIGIPTHGRGGLAHFFSGSIGEGIVNHSNLPVLTVKIFS